MIESLKILSFLGISSNSEISYILLKLIKHQINDVELGHIVFLSFLLKKFDASPLVDALKMSLPMLFQIQVPIKMDHENIPQLAELLQFVSRNRISDKIGMNIITALTMHGENLSPDEARSIIWSICDSKKFLPAHEKLLRNSLAVFKNNLTHYTFDHLDSTLSKLIEKFMQKNSAFYDDEFFSKCVEYVIGRDVGFIKGIYVLKKFNKIVSKTENFFLSTYVDKVGVDYRRYWFFIFFSSGIHRPSTARLHCIKSCPETNRSFGSKTITTFYIRISILNSKLYNNRELGFNKKYN